MFLLGIFIGVLFGVFTMVILSARSYNKGYRDGFDYGLIWSEVPDKWEHQKD